jgi:hypothetical protein
MKLPVYPKVADNSDSIPGRSVDILLFIVLPKMTGLWGKVNWSVKIKRHIALRFSSPVLEL